MSSSPHVQPAVPAIEPCEVRSGGVTVRYRRTGTGMPVVLVRERGGREPWPGLDAALAATSRLIVPEMARGEGLQVRLPAFLAGLGTPRVCVVADGTLWSSAADLVQAPPEQMVRLIVIAPDAGTERDAADRFAEMPRGIPVLTIHRRMERTAAIAATLAFVAEAGGAPAG